MGKEEIREILKHKDLRDIWLYIDDILDSGISIEEVISLGEPRFGYFLDNYETILYRGADPSKFFKLNEKWYLTLCASPIYGTAEKLPTILSTYVKYGADKEYIRKWAENNIPPELIVSQSEEYRVIGLLPEELLSTYFDKYGFKKIWDDFVYDCLSEIVTANEIVKHFPIEVIVRTTNQEGSSLNAGFSRFVREYTHLGGDIDLLADKYLDKYGYPEEDGKLISLAALAMLGAANVDPDRIIDSLSYKAYSYKDREMIAAINEEFYEALKGLASKEKLAKIAPRC